MYIYYILYLCILFYTHTHTHNSNYFLFEIVYRRKTIYIVETLRKIYEFFFSYFSPYVFFFTVIYNRKFSFSILSKSQKNKKIILS